VRPVADPSELTIRRLEPGDLPGLVQCLTRCYGDTYLHKAFYDPEQLRSLLGRELLHSAIAVDTEGEVVAHLGVLLERRGSRTADMILGIVDPRHRGRKLLLQAGIALAPRMLELGLVGLYLYATTAHAISQKLCLAAGSVEAGMLLGFIPEATSSRQIRSCSAASRLPSILLYEPIGTAPARTVHVPKHYRRIVSDIYSRIGLERNVIEGRADLPRRPSAQRIVVDEPRSLVRFVVESVGRDLPDQLMERLRDPGLDSKDVVQLDLGLSDPGTPAAVEALRSLGFFFGGVLPELREGDVIRLQAVKESTVDPAAVALASATGRELLDFVLADADGNAGSAWAR
jgi:serine/threonine-protein kinase RsbW